MIMTSRFRDFCHWDFPQWTTAFSHSVRQPRRFAPVTPLLAAWFMNASTGSNVGSQLHAWVHVDRNGVLQAAERLEDELHRGIDRGPLHGIPCGVKDIIDVAGMPTRAASPLTDPRPASSDAEIVSRLRAAGGIVIGKTATTQFACFDPAPTANPYDASRTPGGSSSGSAVAVAVGTCFAALGTQTGGSILRPAAYCRVVGYKPTFGRWSMQGVVPVSFHLDHVGPMVRDVDDLIAICTAMEEPSIHEPGMEPVDDRPPVFGIPESFFRDRADPQLLAVFDTAVTALTRAGAQMCEVKLPGEFSQVLASHRCIMAVELAQYHQIRFQQQSDQYAQGVAQLIEEGMSTPVLDYAKRALAFGSISSRRCGVCFGKGHRSG